MVLLESNKTRLCVDAFLCSCSAYLLWVDAIAKLQWRICWSLVFMQVMFTRWERVLCTGAGSETCLLVLIRPLVAGTLSLCRSRNGTPRSAASPCRKPVARRLVWCPRSPAVARPWVDGQATVHRYAQAQEFLAKQRLLFIGFSQRENVTAIKFSSLVSWLGMETVGERLPFLLSHFFIRNESGTVFLETKMAPVFQ